ncbi:MAG TPA: cyclase family protein [Flavobacteriia bacterium]|nr:cyclase family protein [Flavobacteriia bacterium]
MKAKIKIKGEKYKVDLAKPLDISVPIAHKKGSLAWYVENPIIEPVIMGNFVGSVKKGAATNFNKITFYPHANATHTECVGHITKEFYSINKLLKNFFFLSEVISILPKRKNKDCVITKLQLKKAITHKNIDALIIRTLPNSKEKKQKDYSNSNPPYLLENAALYLKEIGIKHLLIDLPSVDKEKDDGKLAAHKAFWDYPKNIRLDATITEFIYVTNKITDGLYVLNLQIASIENNATLSKPVLFRVKGK